MNLAELSIKRPVFITAMVILMLILGASALRKMSVDLFPDVTFPVIFVQTVYPGASPLDMEKLVSKPIEDELGSMAGLNKLTSSNSDSVSVVVLEYKIGTDVKDAEQQVRQRLGNIRRQLPNEIKDPVIRRFDPSDQAVIRLAVVGNLEPGKMFDITDEIIKPKIETLSGVGQVSILGGRKREIWVEVDKNKLQDRQMSLLQISEKIKNTSQDIPVGKIESGNDDVVVRASGEFNNLDEIRKVNVQFLGSDQVVRLDSIAKVTEALEEQKSITYFMSKEDHFEKKPAIFLDVFKQSGANTVKVVDNVNSQISKVNKMLEERNIALRVHYQRDMALPIRRNVDDVKESIFVGIILLIVVVFFFLGSFRSTFITAMALPNSLLGGFVLMYMMGFTINMMTLLALSLAVGLLVDDAIVVRENIFRHLERGSSAIKAAVEGTREVAQAVLATTLVVIAVFGPIAFLDGIIGQFFKQFGLTIVFTMIISIFDAFTVAPMLSAYMASSSEHEKGSGWLGRWLEKIESFHSMILKSYLSTLNWVLSHRFITVSTAVVVFVLSLGLIFFIPKSFLPPPDNAEFNVQVELPVGTKISATQKYMEQIEREILKYPYVELASTLIGSSGAQIESHKASVYIRLVPRKDRPYTTIQVKEQFRSMLQPFQKEKTILQVGDVDFIGGGMKAFNVIIAGDNLNELSTYSNKLVPRLKLIPGLVDVDSNFRTGKPELHIEFDRAVSESLGVSTVLAGGELRARTEGVEAATFREQGREYVIRVRLQEKDKDLAKEFLTTTVPNANFNMIPLRKVAKSQRDVGYSQINRQDKARSVTISGNMGAKGNLGDITNEVEKILKEDPEYKLPPALSSRFLGQAQDFRDLLDNMLMAMFLGVAFIYLVLASLYESFITPFTILLALPMAITGALFLLMVTGKSIDIFSLIGLVMLLGVVAKNSILYVDYAHQMIEKGLNRRDALMRAGETRLRPILMTSFALIAGTIPIALGLNEASAQRTSMGVALIGGLVSSTFLTLVVVPAAYGYIDDFRLLSIRVLNKFRPQ